MQLLLQQLLQFLEIFTYSKMSRKSSTSQCMVLEQIKIYKNGEKLVCIRTYGVHMETIEEK